MIFSRLFQVGSLYCTEAVCTICVRPTSSCQCNAPQACVVEIPALSQRVREMRVVVIYSIQHNNIFHYQCLHCSYSFHYKYIVCAMKRNDAAYCYRLKETHLIPGGEAFVCWLQIASSTKKDLVGFWKDLRDSSGPPLENFDLRFISQTLYFWGQISTVFLCSVFRCAGPAMAHLPRRGGLKQILEKLRNACFHSFLLQ